MQFIAGIEGESVWAPLGAGPEWGSRAGGLIRWEVEQQLADLIVVVVLPHVTSPGDTVLEIGWSVIY